MSEPIYKIRYSVEPWNKPVPVATREVVPGIRTAKGDYGYTDVLFLASVMLDEDGEIGSVLLLESGRGSPSRKLLEVIRDQINHHLEHHCG